MSHHVHVSLGNRAYSVTHTLTGDCLYLIIVMVSIMVNLTGPWAHHVPDSKLS